MDINFSTKQFTISVTQLARLSVFMKWHQRQEKSASSISIRAKKNTSSMPSDHFLTDLARAWIGTHQHSIINEKILSMIPDGKDVKKEVTIRIQLEMEDWHITIRGRIDYLVRTIKDHWMIIEIKTTVGTFNIDPIQHDIHRQQIMLYAFLLSWNKKIPPSRITPQLVFVDVSSEEQQIEELSFTEKKASELLEDVIEIIKEIITFEDNEATYWQKNGKSLPWPYKNMRAHQKRLVDDVVNSLLRQEEIHVLLSAPTGFGKTAAALHSLLSVAFSKKRRLFVTTSKKTQRSEYKKILSLINQKLREEGKKPIPFLVLEYNLEDCTCEGLIFPTLSLFRMSSHQRAFSKLEKDGTIDHREFQNTFSCPYHVQQALLPRCRVIIGDHNHFMITKLPETLESITMPRVDGRHPFLLLIDEIHELPARIESSCELTISTKTIMRLLDHVKKETPRLKNTFAPPIRKFLHVIMTTSFVNEDEKQKFIKSLLHWRSILFHLSNQITKFKISNDLARMLHQLMEESTKISMFSSMSIQNLYFESSDEECTDNDVDSSNKLIKISFLHPKEFLSRIWKEYHHVLGMSATIHPLAYYQDLLGFSSSSTISFQYPEPFSPQARLVLVVPTVDTRFNQRENNARLIAEEIINIFLTHPARYLVVYPSFHFLKLVSPLLSSYHHRVTIITQNPSLTKKEQEQFITALKDNQRCIIQVVSGSIFTEGVNLPSLAGVIIISPHLLPPTPKREHLVKHLIQEGMGHQEAWRHVYLFPALIKMIQAAGRLIRNVNDKGVIIFLGKRFMHPHIQEMFPSFLKPEYITHDPNPLIKSFWRQDE